jgi:hypothetical protein
MTHLHINKRTATQPHDKPSHKQQNKEYPEIKGSCSYVQKEHEWSKVGAKTDLRKSNMHSEIQFT